MKLTVWKVLSNWIVHLVSRAKRIFLCLWVSKPKSTINFTLLGLSANLVSLPPESAWSRALT